MHLATDLATHILCFIKYECISVFRPFKRHLIMKNTLCRNPIISSILSIAWNPKSSEGSSNISNGFQKPKQP